jgi:dephospho-CoA kinase
MLKVGLTGNLGSGKSYVAEIFHHLGIPVYYSDLRARHLMNDTPVLAERIRELFGESIYQNNRLNTSLLADIVFRSKSSLELLNNLVHPYVKDDFNRWCNSHADKPYVIIESALVFESGLQSLLDRVITVTAPESLRWQRVKTRDSMTHEQFLLRQQHQICEEEKAARSDFVIINDDRHPLLHQITDIDQCLRQLS